jgi:hypothetical protein
MSPTAVMVTEPPGAAGLVRVAAGPAVRVVAGLAVVGPAMDAGAGWPAEQAARTSAATVPMTGPMTGPSVRTSPEGLP